jgi:hypothetical protein
MYLKPLPENTGNKLPAKTPKETDTSVLYGQPAKTLMPKGKNLLATPALALKKPITAKRAWDIIISKISFAVRCVLLLILSIFCFSILACSFIFTPSVFFLNYSSQKP